MFWNNWYEDGYIPCVYFKFGVIVSPLLSWLVFSHKIWLLIILFPNFVAFLDGFSALKIWQILPWFICFGSLIVCYIRKKKKSSRLLSSSVHTFSRVKRYTFHFYGLTKEKRNITQQKKRNERSVFIFMVLQKKKKYNTTKEKKWKSV